MNEIIYNKAKSYLEEIYGDKAEFREGQYEAIEAAVVNKRSLVVQKTGWGKSLVYFIASKIISEEMPGVTVVITPLLALMENQCEAAEKIGLRTAVFNSKVDKDEMLQRVKEKQVDVMFLTPESMIKMQNDGVFSGVVINFLVIDEAHCISDWGHDFRLTYTQLKNVIQELLDTVPVLATTATASSRVEEDIVKQLGKNTYTVRGTLLRTNLGIKVLEIPEYEGRYAWILENLDKLEGHGIIYGLTKYDVENLTTFLQNNGKNVLSYYSRSNTEEYLNDDAILKFKKNEIKALVSTVKLGMGYDKGDVSFIIHLQQPSNIISYYQQIGRAGRDIDMAQTFLMCSGRDREIQDYFINNAFPSKVECEEVLKAIEGTEGITKSRIENLLNLSSSRIDKTLMFLESEKAINKQIGKRPIEYTRSINPYTYPAEYYEGVKNQRRMEQSQMTKFTKITSCYNRYIVNELDDTTSGDCGVCSNCIPWEVQEYQVQDSNWELATAYLNIVGNEITPRKRLYLSDNEKMSNIPSHLVNDTGYSLVKYGRGEVGRLVREGKYPVNKELVKPRFDDKLVVESAQFLARNIKDIKSYVFVPMPSLRSDIVKDFTERLAEKVGCKSYDLVTKVIDSPAQKTMENSIFQCKNAKDAFKVAEDMAMHDRIILVDDMVDSKWTLTMAGYRLKEKGAREVIPFTLADSSKNGE